MKFLSIALYHGCGRCYLDGKIELIADNEGCKMTTNNPFWKRPDDSYNRISKSTRSKPKKENICKFIISRKIFQLIQKINNFGQLMNQVTIQTKTVQVTLNQTYQINCQTIIKPM